MSEEDIVKPCIKWDDKINSTKQYEYKNCYEGMKYIQFVVCLFCIVSARLCNVDY